MKTCIFLFIFLFKTLIPNEINIVENSFYPKYSKVSYYHNSLHGKRTASGQRYNKFLFTAAHKTIKIGTVVEFKNPQNGKTLRVIINDRGPYVKGRDFDLSYASAEKLGFLKSGVAVLEWKIISL